MIDTLSRQYLSRIEHDKERMFRYISGSTKLLSILGAVAIPTLVIIDIAASPYWYYDTLVVRIIGGAVCLPLFFYPQTPPSWKPYWEQYAFWVYVPMFAFVWGVMLLGNAAANDPSAPADMLYWVLQYVVALFVLTQLAYSAYLATTTYLVGTAAAIVWVYLTVDTINWPEVKRVFGWPLGAYLTAIIVASLTNRNPEIVRSESLAAARAIGSNIAHEMRTPLSGIASRAKAAGRHLPSLVESYHAAREAGLPVEPLTERQLELLATSFEDIEKEAQYSNVIIDMLLVNTSENPVFGQSLVTLPASTLVDNALQRYPFANDRERNLAHQDTLNDFEATVPRILLDHVLFNLIKNALYYVQKHGSGSVTISIDQHPSPKFAGTITVYDDGPGIPAAYIDRVFDRFFTTTTAGRGSGIGLNFCKMVMEGIGGSIQAESVEGAYTRIILSFPNAPRPELDSELSRSSS